MFRKPLYHFLPLLMNMNCEGIDHGVLRDLWPQLFMCQTCLQILCLCSSIVVHLLGRLEIIRYSLFPKDSDPDLSCQLTHYSIRFGKSVAHFIPSERVLSLVILVSAAVLLPYSTDHSLHSISMCHKQNTYIITVSYKNRMRCQHNSVLLH